MSLAETQELMRTMQELMALLNNIQARTTQLNNDQPITRETLATFRQLERVALRYLALAERMGLPPDAQKAIDLLMKVIVTARMAQISINMLMMSNPVTAAIGFAGLLMTVTTIPGMLEGY
jgi:hypothetical protein